MPHLHRGWARSIAWPRPPTPSPDRACACGQRDARVQDIGETETQKLLTILPRLTSVQDLVEGQGANKVHIKSLVPCWTKFVLFNDVLDLELEVPIILIRVLILPTRVPMVPIRVLIVMIKGTDSHDKTRFVLFDDVLDLELEARLRTDSGHIQRASACPIPCAMRLPAAPCATGLLALLCRRAGARLCTMDALVVAPLC